MMKNAGCSLVAPPTGIIATARCLPGVRPADETWDCGRAAPRARTGARTAPDSVPLSLARTGWYWPDGHQAQASSATRPATAAASTTAPPRPAAAPRVALRPRRARCAGPSATLPTTGRAKARSRATTEVEHRRANVLVGQRRDDVRGRTPRSVAASLGSSRIGVSAMLSRIGTVDQHPHRHESARAAGQRRRLALPATAAGGAASGRCARRDPGRRSRRRGRGSRRPG